jgi:uncharacterized membrane protein YhaH (DUF805 family)
VSGEFWFLDRDGNQQGPVERSEFIKLMRGGVVGRDSLIWAAGMDEWQMAGQVDGFSSLLAPPAPPPRRLSDENTRRIQGQDAPRATVRTGYSERQSDVRAISAVRIAGAPPKRDWPMFYLSPAGRISRRDFWLFGFLPVAGVLLFLSWIPLLGWLLAIVCQWCLIALSFKRFHDCGYSGWWMFAGYVPAIAGYAYLAMGFFTGNHSDYLIGAIFLGIGFIIGLVQFVLIYLRVGQQGPNKYGPDPLEIAN